MMHDWLNALIKGIGLTLFFSTSLAYSYEFQPRIVGGVESSVQDWQFMAALMPPSESAGELTVGFDQFDAIVMSGSPARRFVGNLANCDLAQSTCPDVDGKVCLITRGDNTFAEKVSNCAAGGGIAAIIFNNTFGLFQGIVDADTPRIPAVSISDTDGSALLDLLGQEVSFEVTSRRASRSFCGGSYIGGKWILTAAHCVTDAELKEISDPATIEVNIGGHDLATDLDNVIAVKRIEVHQDYNFKVPPINDLALLELESEPKGVASVALASRALLNLQISEGRNATAIGRGLQDIFELGEPLRGSTTSRLFEVELPLVSNEVCNAEFNALATKAEERNPVTPEMMCAGGDRNFGTCAGDSGGPLLLLDNDEYKIVGLTSWGIGCAEGQTTDVYTRVPNYISQINDVVSGRSLRLGRLVPSSANNDNSSDFGIGAFGGLQLLMLAGLAGLRTFFQRQGKIGPSCELIAGKTSMPLLVASASILLSACVEPAAQTVSGELAMQRLEPLQAVSVDAAGIHITVTTTGCTRSEHFQIEAEKNKDRCDIAIYRTKADLCRRSPMPVTLVLSWPEHLSCGDLPINVKNPVGADMHQASPSGYRR